MQAGGALSLGSRILSIENMQDPAVKRLNLNEIYTRKS